MKEKKMDNEKYLRNEFKKQSFLQRVYKIDPEKLSAFFHNYSFSPIQKISVDNNVISVETKTKAGFETFERLKFALVRMPNVRSVWRQHNVIYIEISCEVVNPI